jgi:pimeloyl-ACP methyl ester carboxylesterase
VQRVADEFPHVDGVEHRFVELDGLRVHVAEAGDPGAPPVLLLHGWPQHWYMWHRVIERMAPHRRLIAPDLRGFGWSDAPGDGYDAETFARDQVALLDALGIERAAVLGHDWGGWTAFLLGIRHPERVSRMVVCNAPHPWPRVSLRLLPDTWRSWYAAVLATPGVGPLALRRMGLAARILTHGNVGTPFTPEELRVYLDRFRPPERAHAASSLYRYYERIFLRGLTRREPEDPLTVPALLLFGERDRYVSRRLITDPGRRAPELQIEFVPDSGHFIVNERPDLVASRALDFLASPAAG